MAKVVPEEYLDWWAVLVRQFIPESPFLDDPHTPHGCTRRYRELRDRIRQQYRDTYALTAKARANSALNPGNGWVGPLCHEPQVSLAALHEMMGPYLASGDITLLTETHPVAAEVTGDTVEAVTVFDNVVKKKRVLIAPYFIDATEEGDMLPLTKTEYVTGSESQRETGEPHALQGAADPNDMQGITYCFAMSYHPGEDHTIERPEMYDFWRNYQAPVWPGRQLSWTSPVPWTGEPETKTLFLQQGETDVTRSLWLFRQICDVANFEPGSVAHPITLVNWPQNDYWLGDVINCTLKERKHRLWEAQQLSLSLLYWMQTEASRPEGGQGYPGLTMRPDITGTKDGLAMAPYIRESRRIKAQTTVVEQDLAVACRPDGPRLWRDSVGIGSYRIDLHPSTGGRPYIDIGTWNFQILLVRFCLFV
jgi:hypothetical protein